MNLVRVDDLYLNLDRIIGAQESGIPEPGSLRVVMESGWTIELGATHAAVVRDRLQEIITGKAKAMGSDLRVSGSGPGAA